MNYRNKIFEFLNTKRDEICYFGAYVFILTVFYHFSGNVKNNDENIVKLSFLQIRNQFMMNENSEFLFLMKYFIIMFSVLNNKQISFSKSDHKDFTNAYKIKLRLDTLFDNYQAIQSENSDKLFVSLK